MIIVLVRISSDLIYGDWNIKRPRNTHARLNKNITQARDESDALQWPEAFMKRPGQTSFLFFLLF